MPKKGNLLFEQSEPQDTYDYLLDAYESDMELLPVVDKKIADLEKKIGTRPADIDKVQKWKQPQSPLLNWITRPKIGLLNLEKTA